MYTHRLLRRALTHIQRNEVSQPHTNTPHKTRKKWQNGTAIDKCWIWWSHTCACVCGTVDNKSFQMYASRHRHSTPLRQPVSLTVSTNNENICLSSAMLNIPPMFNWLQSQLCTMEKITNKKLEKEKNLRYPELSFKVNLEATSRLWNRLKNRKFFSLIRSIEFRLAQKSQFLMAIFIMGSGSLDFPDENYKSIESISHFEWISGCGAHFWRKKEEKIASNEKTGSAGYTTEHSNVVFDQFQWAIAHVLHLLWNSASSKITYMG